MTMSKMIFVVSSVVVAEENFNCGCIMIAIGMVSLGSVPNLLGDQ